MTPGELAAVLQTPWRHGEHLDARGAVFDEPVVLDGMSVRGFDLSGARFRSGFSAKGTTFQGLAWLMDARIDGPCDLTGAQFRIDLRAEGLAAEVLALDHVQVRGVLALARVRARRISLSHALIMANLTLENADLRDGIDLSEAEVMGGLWADGAHLGKVNARGCDLYGRRRNWDAAPA